MFILFIGPAPNPVTGQSFAFHTIYDNYDGQKKLFCFPCDKGFFSNLVVFCCFLFFLIKNKKCEIKLYITTSRTKGGFFRDSLFIVTARLFKLKIINHLHGADFKAFRSSSGFFLKKIIDFIYKSIEVSIVLSEGMRSQYDMYPSMSIEVVSNFTKNYATDYKSKNNIFSIVYFSNIMYSKGITYLVDAFNLLSKDYPNVQLNIAGLFMGDDYLNENEIHDLFFSKINHVKNIHYFGPLYDEKKKSLLCSSHVMVLPTFYKTEAQPISIIEGMSAGCVIISTKHNYIADLINANNGFLIPIQSSYDIYMSLKHCYDNVVFVKTVSEFNQMYASDFYSEEKYISSISSILYKD